jgi:hypothetical protein
MKNVPIVSGIENAVPEVKTEVHKLKNADPGIVPAPGSSWKCRCG